MTSTIFVASNMNERFVLVTGARGFIGRYVSRKLAQDGHLVVGLGHGAWPESEFVSGGLTDWFNGDITTANLDVIAAKHGMPGAIVHLAGGSSVGLSIDSPVEDFRRTVVGAADLLEWVRIRSPETRVVLASSAAVYGSEHALGISEESVCKPYSPYGFHKRMVELLFESYAKNFGINVAIVRLFSVYGVGLRKQLLWDLCGRLSQGLSEIPMGGTGDETRDWLHVEDAARLITMMLTRADNTAPIINGGTGIRVSVKEIAGTLCSLWGSGAAPVFSGKSRLGDPINLVASVESLTEIGFVSQRELSQGLTEYVAWYQAQKAEVSR